jgi:hypothetical protein
MAFRNIISIGALRKRGSLLNWVKPGAQWNIADEGSFLSEYETETTAVFERSECNSSLKFCLWVEQASRNIPQRNIPICFSNNELCIKTNLKPVYK